MFVIAHYNATDTQNVGATRRAAPTRDNDVLLFCFLSCCNAQLDVFCAALAALLDFFLTFAGHVLPPLSMCTVAECNDGSNYENGSVQHLLTRLL